MKKEVAAPTKQDTTKKWAVAAIKVTLGLAFIAAGMSLAGYNLHLTAVAKEVLGGLNAVTGIWILLSHVK